MSGAAERPDTPGKKPAESGRPEPMQRWMDFLNQNESVIVPDVEDTAGERSGESGRCCAPRGSVGLIAVPIRRRGTVSGIPGRRQSPALYHR